MLDIYFYKSSKISANHELLKKTFTEHKKKRAQLLEN